MPLSPSNGICNLATEDRSKRVRSVVCTSGFSKVVISDKFASVESVPAPVSTHWVPNTDTLLISHFVRAFSAVVDVTYTVPECNPGALDADEHPGWPTAARDYGTIIHKQELLRAAVREAVVPTKNPAKAQPPSPPLCPYAGCIELVRLAWVVSFFKIVVTVLDIGQSMRTSM